MRNGQGLAKDRARIVTLFALSKISRTVIGPLHLLRRADLNLLGCRHPLVRRPHWKRANARAPEMVGGTMAQIFTRSLADVCSISSTFTEA